MAHSNHPQHKFVAHRGYQSAYPENTLLAFNKAIEAGACYFELDVQLSADGQAIVYHDADLQRMSMRVERVVDLSAEELIKIPAFEPGRFAEQYKTTKICKLSDVASLLKRHPEVHCYVEVKAENSKHFSYEQILNALSQALAEVVDQCIIISFDVELIAAAQAQGWPRLGWVLSAWDQVEIALHNAPYLEVIFCNINYLDETADIYGAPWRWVVYEIAKIDQALALFELGVDQVETFAIADMLEQYDAKIKAGKANT